MLWRGRPEAYDDACEFVECVRRPARPGVWTGARIPGLVTSIAVTVGQKVAKSDKLLMMEAMKMQTTVYATADGVVSELHCAVGETVESKDLLVRLRA